MKFCALALDYDGTIARDGRLDPGVRPAIARLRAQGIVVVLVTGRILDDLRRCTGGEHFVDAIVAENGGVLAFPDSGYSTTLGQAPPQALMDELSRARIPFAAGQTLLDASASDAERILRAIRQLELPLALAFNRGRLMVLPQAVSKATGLRHALATLRLSPHNTIAIGDAENDHELLRVCELGVAVGWGSERLQSEADVVIPGTGPEAIPGYLEELARCQEIPAPRRTRRVLRLGHTDAGDPVSLAVRGRNVLVAGDPKSGKSWITGLLCEQLILYGYCLCILDPEGDYTSLGALPGVTVVGGADPLPRPRELLRALRHPDTSLVVDLSHAKYADKLEYLAATLPGLATLRRRTGLPHRIVVDEAHYFLHDSAGLELLDLDLKGYTLVTYRASRIVPAVLESHQVVVVTRESDPAEVAALHTLCRSCDEQRSLDEWHALLGTLLVGEAVVLPVTDEAGGHLRRIRLAPRLTPHVRHFTKYIDIPVPTGRAFTFWRDGAPSHARAHTLREFVSIVEQSPPELLDGHVQRGDFSRWVADVFGDYPLAVELRRVEQQHAERPAEGIGARLGQAVRARYDLVDPILLPGDIGGKMP